MRTDKHRRVGSGLVLAATLLLGIGSSVREAWAQGSLFVSNYNGDRITVYPRTVEGDVQPSYTISTDPGPHQIAINNSAGELVVASNRSYKITVYDSGTGVLKRTIFGDQTGLNRPTGLAVDEVNQELYVANDYGNSITVYGLVADGNVPPKRTIAGSSTGLSGPAGVAVDLAHNEIVVANYALPWPTAGSITVYPRTASGNVVPLRTIQGISTGLHLPQGIAVDLAHEEIVVANSAFTSPDAGAILTFRRTAIDNAAPIRTLGGPATKLCNPVGLTLDRKHDELVVASSNFGGGTCDQTVTTYPGYASGDYPPIRTLGGSSAGLSNPISVALTTGPLVTLTGPQAGSLYPVNAPVSFTATFTDPIGGAHTGTWTFDDLAQPATIVEPSGATPGSASASYTFANAGVYKVRLTVNDCCGGSGTADQINGLEAFVVIYDPSNGFVTGGGWINSPLGAYRLDPTLVGKATFGFESKYKKGASVPTGKTEFRFKTGNLDFQSTAYQWLVVSGAKAQYKGTGTINGTGAYDFLITVTDGKLNGGVDKFRIKIRDGAAGLVYDNAPSGSDDIDLVNPQAIDGGNIVIHK